MSELFGSVWWLLVTLGLLVTFHEFGHFWVARRVGVTVLRFSVGFGKALWTRRGRDGTEYTIGAIPLGGYVKMLDEREAEVPADKLHGAFNRKSVWARIAVTAAGPIANLLFAVAAFWLMFVVGRPDFQPLIGPTTGIAAEAGLRDGDRIVRFAGAEIDSWTAATMALIESGLARNDVEVVVQREGTERSFELPLSRIEEGADERAALKAIGVRLKDRAASAVIGTVGPGTPAAAADLRVGDRIVAVNTIRVNTFEDLRTTVQQQAALDPKLTLTIRRDEVEQQIALTVAQVKAADGSTAFQIGIGQPATPSDALLRLGPIDAIPAAFKETWNTAASTVNLLRHLVVGNASLSNVSGPIGIARTANFSAQLGAGWFLMFLATLSLSIAILNLLPIPILDGGHLLYYLIELVKGSPVSERTMVMGQYVGLAFLLGLVSLAFYNDIFHMMP